MWQVYGVGQVGVTPLFALSIWLYKTCVSTVIGLVAGLPAVRNLFVSAAA